MKHFLLLLSFLSLCLCGHAQGWPSRYTGVMLQGFYWDSYDETKWTALQSEADVLAKSFNAIWVPQSGYCNTGIDGKSMGYNPVWWFNQNSSFGTKDELKSMIKTYRDKNVAIIEDVVINHKSGDTDWCDFPKETWNGNTLEWSFADICSDDEAAAQPKFQGKTFGNHDTGDSFGYRDLDHTSVNVQKNVKLYLRFLKEEMGYQGFRYDMVKGYGAEFVKIYNEYAKPDFSVGEYWDYDYNNVANWIKGTGYTSAAFDFPLKNIINDAFGKGNWGALTNKGLVGDPYMSRYSVTFVDNHDTYRNENNDQLQHNVLAANAFILAMPGTPCIFLPHWKAYQTELEKMIAARKEAGINNQSKIVYGEYRDGGYVTIVQGDKRKIMIVSGYPKGIDTNGYEPVSVGTPENPNYAFYKEKNPVKDLTVYVEANTSPLYLYTWESSRNVLTDPYPGTMLTQKRLVGDKVFYYMTFKSDKLNFLLNKGGDDTKTADVNDIVADVFYAYNNNQATDLTLQYNNQNVEGEVDPLVYRNGETVAYFEAPEGWAKVACWAWNGDTNYTGGSWPGQQCTYIGKAANGNKIWKWTCNPTAIGEPAKIMFNDGVDNTSQKSGEFTFENGGYYNLSAMTKMGKNVDEITCREFRQGVKSTVCLPFNLDEDEVRRLDGTIYQFYSAKNGIFYFKPSKVLEAFKPYVFIAAHDRKSLEPYVGKELLVGQPIPTIMGDYSFVGTMSKQTKTSTDEALCYIYTAREGVFSKANRQGGVVVPAFRCHFLSKTQAVAPSKLCIMDIPTGLRCVDVPTDDNVYSIQGVCMGNRLSLPMLPKGIYIYKGKKVLITR